MRSSNTAFALLLDRIVFLSAAGFSNFKFEGWVTFILSRRSILVKHWKVSLETTLLSTPHLLKGYFMKSELQVCRPDHYHACYGTDILSAFGDESETECNDELLVAEMEGELGSLSVFSYSSLCRPWRSNLRRVKHDSISDTALLLPTKKINSAWFCVFEHHSRFLGAAS